MRLKITHETTYHYSEPVFLEPHSLRFRPHGSPVVELKWANLHVWPEPAGQSLNADAEGNWVDHCWFNGLHKRVTFKWELAVDIMDRNPFDFIVYPAHFLAMPFVYDDNLNLLLQPSLQQEPHDKAFDNYIDAVLESSDNETVAFMVNLTRQIHRDFILETRPVGDTLYALTTFNLKRGACRDLAWLQVQMLRAKGIAARFVSGYLYLPDANGEHDLHAWVEAYLPGAGWLAFDPSHGVVCGSSYVPVSSSFHFENTMAVSGTIRGNAQTELSAHVSIEEV
jgi:transglutaminase-like putative cysteine protease